MRWKRQKMNNPQTPKPPRPARFILRNLKHYNERFAILTDLDEVFASIQKDNGRLYASLWYWLQCLISLYKYFIYFFTWRTTMFKNYLKLALRAIKRNKINSIINITGLAVGMACTILIFIWIQNELSYENFHKNRDDIYLIAWERLANNRHYTSTPPPFADRLKQDFPEFSKVVRVSLRNQQIVKVKDKAFNEKQIAVADPSLFQIFTYPMIQGDPEKALTKPGTVVLTESTAKKYFENEDPLQKIIHLDGKSHEICAVIKDVPDNSEIDFDLVTRIKDLPVFRQSQKRQWNYFSFYTYVQVKKETNILSINEKLSRAMKQYRPWDPYDRYFYLFPLRKLHLHDVNGGGLIKYVYIFSLAAFFILAVSCINFINLSTARSAKRAKEVGIRKVIGSDRKMLIWQFLSESFFNVLLAFGLGLLLVLLLLPAFNTLVNQALSLQFADGLTITTLFLILFLTVLFSGIYPAFYLSSFSPVKIFRSGFSRGKSRFRQILVTAQFAISILLLICTLIVLDQINFMKHADLGFKKQNLVSIPLTQNMSKNTEPIKKAILMQPEVIEVSTQGSRNQGGTLKWEGMNPELSFLENEVNFKMIDYSYFRTLNADIIEGRDFSKRYGSDFQSGYIINEEAVKLWQIDSPVGRSLSLCGRSGRIIGIVKNIHMGLKEELRAEIYYLAPIGDNERFTSLNIRISSAGIKNTMKFLEKIWKEANGNTPFEYAFFDQEINKKYQQEEQVSRIFSHFAFLSIFVSCLGLFGLASFITEQKTKEIGIRKVLGASAPKILALLNKEFLRCVLAANILAWPLGWFIMHYWLREYPYRTGIGWGFFMLSALLAVILTLATVSFQAIRAAFANPVDSLRYE
jgi:putative ABC transport system permease protein